MFHPAKKFLPLLECFLEKYCMVFTINFKYKFNNMPTFYLMELLKRFLHIEYLQAHF